MLRRPAMTAVSVAIAVSAACGADWPAYRADSRRSAYSAKSIKGDLKLTWSFKSPHAPTPA